MTDPFPNFFRLKQKFDAPSVGDQEAATPAKQEIKEPFPPGSLTKYADEWNEELGPMAAAMGVPIPGEGINHLQT
jgi:hypothetical protein